MPRGYPTKKKDPVDLDETQADGVESSHDDDVSPAHKHAVKLKRKAKAVPENHPVSTEYEMVGSKFGRIKFRRVIRMQNGNVHRLICSKEEYEKAVGKKKKG